MKVLEQIAPTRRPGAHRIELRSILVSMLIHTLAGICLWLIVFHTFSGRSIALTMSPTADSAETSFELITESPAADPTTPADVESVVEIEPLQWTPAATERLVAEVGKGLNPPSVNFFGTHAYGTRFVYLLDVSFSMNARQGHRYQRACDELMRSISQLSDDQQYHVILFCWDTFRMFSESTHELRRPVVGHEKKLADWIYDFSLGAGTDPRRALSIAYQMQPDAVFLLSDGQFNQPRTPLARTGWLPEFNLSLKTDVQGGIEAIFRNLPIHTFAFENPFTVVDMQAIADTSGGSCRYIQTDSFEPIDEKAFRQAIIQVEEAIRADQRNARSKVTSRGEFETRLYSARRLISDGELVYAEYLLRPLAQTGLSSPQAASYRPLREILDRELGDVRLEDFLTAEQISSLLSDTP